MQLGRPGSLLLPALKGQGGITSAMRSTIHANGSVTHSLHVPVTNLLLSVAGSTKSVDYFISITQVTYTHTEQVVYSITKYKFF